jgi:hypothetical protein
MSLCEKCARNESVAMRMLESLTAGGSEFVDEPQRCAESIRDTRNGHWRHILKLTKENKALQAELNTLRNKCLSETGANVRTATNP